MAEVLSTPRVPARTVGLIASMGVFMAFLDNTVVGIAFPNLVQSFPDAGIDGLSWVLNAYAIVFAALLVPAGRIADLLGGGGCSRPASWCSQSRRCSARSHRAREH